MSVSLFHERLIIMAKSNKNLHLTLSERQIIQRGIENGATKASIAATLGKDKSTIGKEIKAHRKHSHYCSFDPACANKDRCKHHHVCKDCADLVVFKCKRRDRSPGACNGCPKFQHCRFDKFTYSADLANKEYMADLIESREGINMTYSELKALADIIVPLIKKGHSPYHIITSHPELNISEKTLYNYIESGVFRQFGLLDIDLRVKTRRISKKDSVKYKKREDRRFLIGRTYKDFISYTDDHDNVSIVEMDTVYNGQSGPFMQTFIHKPYLFVELLILQRFILSVLYFTLRTNFKMSLSKDGIFIGRVLIQSEDGIFPLICFNSFVSKISSASEDDVISVEGTFKDYSYSDYNGVLHFVKLMLITSITINGIKQSATAEEKKQHEEYWKRIKNIYQVIDIVEFERLSKMEGAVELCCL